MKIEMTVAGIRKAIKSVVSRATKWQDDVQDVALACLTHTKEHGDWTLSIELLDGITQVKGVKFAKLKQYFEAMMSASLVEGDEKGAMVFAYDEGKNQSDINLDMAKAVKWYDFKVPSVKPVVDLDYLLEQFEKLSEKALKAHSVDKAALDRIRAAYTNELVKVELKAVA